PKSIVTCFYPFINSLKIESHQVRSADTVNPGSDEIEGETDGGEREEDGSEARTGREENNG
ncbi:MAG TPA: hypothetical protein VFE91_06905, partial [Nitrososphaerales archaeon]|nr:hypothetical protein [Nitrososphaerales archaeon]